MTASHNFREISADQHIRVAADAAIFTVLDGRLGVLLVQLRNPEALAGKWALPGGLLADDETAEEAVRRILAEHCGVTGVHVEQLAAFDSLGRDPRSRVVSLAHLALVPAPEKAPAPSAKYEAVRFWPVAKLPSLAYDHAEVMGAAIARLRSGLPWSPIAADLLPPEFTLTELQSLYEIIAGERLDKRNFRKKVLADGLLRRAGRKAAGAHRPAELYRFASQRRRAG